MYIIYKITINWSKYLFKSIRKKGKYPITKDMEAFYRINLNNQYKFEDSLTSLEMSKIIRYKLKQRLDTNL